MKPIFHFNGKVFEVLPHSSFLHQRTTKELWWDTLLFISFWNYETDISSLCVSLVSRCFLWKFEDAYGQVPIGMIKQHGYSLYKVIILLSDVPWTRRIFCKSNMSLVSQSLVSQSILTWWTIILDTRNVWNFRWIRKCHSCICLVWMRVLVVFFLTDRSLIVDGSRIHTPLRQCGRKTCRTSQAPVFR